MKADISQAGISKVHEESGYVPPSIRPCPAVIARISVAAGPSGAAVATTRPCYESMHEQLDHGFEAVPCMIETSADLEDMLRSLPTQLEVVEMNEENRDSDEYAFYKPIYILIKHGHANQGGWHVAELFNIGEEATEAEYNCKAHHAFTDRSTIANRLTLKTYIDT